MARRYFHTRAGYEATVLLGRLHLDRGRPLAAALCWRRVLDTPAAATAFEPELSVQLAASYFQAGRTEAAEQVLRGLRERVSQTGLRVGSQPLGKLPAPGEELAWLTSRFASGASASGDGTSAQWAIYRGDPARNAATAGGIPLRSPRWLVATAGDPADDRLLERLDAGLRRRRSAGDSRVAAAGRQQRRLDAFP